MCPWVRAFFYKCNSYLRSYRILHTTFHVSPVTLYWSHNGLTHYIWRHKLHVSLYELFADVGKVTWWVYQMSMQTSSCLILYAASLGHRTRCWICQINGALSFERRDVSNLCHLNVEIWYNTQRCLINSAQQGSTKDNVFPNEFHIIKMNWITMTYCLCERFSSVTISESGHMLLRGNIFHYDLVVLWNEFCVERSHSTVTILSYKTWRRKR